MKISRETLDSVVAAITPVIADGDDPSFHDLRKIAEVAVTAALEPAAYQSPKNTCPLGLDCDHEREDVGGPYGIVKLEEEVAP